MLERKVQPLIQENGITLLPKDPTDQFHKQIQQALQRCNTLVKKIRHKFLLNIKPTAPQLNAYIKTHKEGEPIRPVINNRQVPSYKTAKFLNKKLLGLMDMPNIYNTKNSYEVARDLHNIEINPYPTAFPYGNGMVLHFYQQQESSTTKTVHKVINKGLKAYV